MALVTLVLGAGLGLAACGMFDDPAQIRNDVPRTLVGTTWRVQSVARRSPAAGVEPTIAFAAGELKGSGGCNSFGGKYDYDGATGAFAVTDFGGTAMACVDQARTDYESLFFAALGQVTSASTDPTTGTLFLNGPAGQIVLIPLDQAPA
jgi:heat shock protein HslJ